MHRPAFAAARTFLPDAPAVAVDRRAAAWLVSGAPVETLSHAEAVRRIAGGAAPIVCHGPAVAQRLGAPSLAGYDVLELFAYVRPARFCIPTLRGLAAALLLPIPDGIAAEATTLCLAARALLAELTASPREEAVPIAWAMTEARWRWGPAVLAALGEPEVPRGLPGGEALRVWQRLREWEDVAPEGAAEARPVEGVEARARLVKLLGGSGEPRPQQMAFATHAAAAFQPRERVGEPHVVLAEAGTGIGKTLGYIAPALVWAEKNNAPVWISTFTRNLQRQIDQELDRAFPNLRTKAQAVVVRKGRENLFCLLNYEEAVARLPVLAPRDVVALGLVARWMLATRDGDMVGGDFPAWLGGLFSASVTTELTDTHGECTYNACRHFRRCFIERAARRARHARIVVANHAFVMVRAARGDDAALPTRYVFDEAHHLFDAADAAFSARLSGRETAELRRWLRGAEDPGGSRRRGLRERAGDLLARDSAALAALDSLMAAARRLPAPGWRQRLQIGQPHGPVEEFLMQVRDQVLARNRDGDIAYSLEAAVRPLIRGLLPAANALEEALEKFCRPVSTMVKALAERLDNDAASLDSHTRQRLEGVRLGLERRVLAPVEAWQTMLLSLAEAPSAEFVDWFGIDRGEHGEIDIGFCRHWFDPMQPFAEAVLRPSHGALMTSATLRDASGDDDADWSVAEQRTGVRNLPAPAVLSTLGSPFDYPQQTRAFVVTDVDRNDVRQVAAAYRELFIASGGGALGLFTAIARLRAVHAAIAGPLEAAGLALLAQHVDPLDTGTLIDIFRAEEDSCLLGTDAVRDGIDVPGRALRLIVFDRVPWPRPSLLHQARREAGGGRQYEEMLVRLRLRQAFGRLIRRADDRGVFVMLDRQLPTRLTSALPAGVVIRRVGLATAVAEVSAFLAA